MRSWEALVADVTCVVTFVAVGRASHDEGLGLVGLLTTAWPFLVGVLLGHLLALARRQPASLVSGALVWVATVVVGMLLRALTGGGVQTSFVITTAIILAVLILGWRGVRALVVRARRHRFEALRQA